MFTPEPLLTREVVNGRFGQLSVSDIAGVRNLNCDSACHGSAWLEPSIDIAGVHYSPGPIPESIYLLGWLLAVAANPQGHVLMAGLGSGVGPIALAWAYPKLRISVVEVDPVMIGLARRHYPLLSHFEALGQIRVIEQDIIEHVWLSTNTDWSIACLDAYTDAAHPVCPSPLLQALHGRAEALCLNALEEHELHQTEHLADGLMDAGWNPAWTMPIHDPFAGVMCGNVLLGTQPLPLVALRSFTPFSTIDHPKARLADHQLSALVATTRPWSSWESTPD